MLRTGLVMMLWLGGTALARDTQRARGETYVAPARLTATDQPGGRREVFALEAGERAPVLKHGGPGGAYCKLQHGTSIGWVPCPAGPDAHASPRPPATTPPLPAPPATVHAGPHSGPSFPIGSASGCASTCTASRLFPTPPELTPVDREVLALCPARPEASVTRAEVRRFFAAHLADARLQGALSAAGRSGNREAGLDWLTGLWVGSGPRNAFTHVFCGDDWTRDAIGGLHFLPRFAQLEAEGKVCYGGPVHGASPRRNGQYAIRFRGVAPWSCANKPTGGFPEDHDPIALAAAATRAFASCCPREPSDKGGLYAGPELPGITFQIWCGTRNGSYGIASFYPAQGRPTCGTR